MFDIVLKHILYNSDHDVYTYYCCNSMFPIAQARFLEQLRQSTLLKIYFQCIYFVLIAIDIVIEAVIRSNNNNITSTVYMMSAH